MFFSFNTETWNLVPLSSSLPVLSLYPVGLRRHYIRPGSGGRLGCLFFAPGSRDNSLKRRCFFPMPLPALIGDSLMDMLPGCFFDLLCRRKSLSGPRETSSWFRRPSLPHQLRSFSFLFSLSESPAPDEVERGSPTLSRKEGPPLRRSDALKHGLNSFFFFPSSRAGRICPTS